MKRIKRSLMHTEPKLFYVFAQMKSRCCNPNHSHYKNTGGMGIKVCQEWLDSPISFIAWAKANGWQPGYFINRRDTYKDYSPDNCFVSEKKKGRTKKDFRDENRVSGT